MSTSRDLHNNIKAIRAFGATITSNTTTQGTIIDTTGYESLEFVIVSNQLADGNYVPQIQESDDAALTGATTVAAGDLLGTAAAATFVATDDNVAKKIGYRGNRRYVRLNLVSTSVTTGGPLAAVAILSHARNVPLS